MTNSQTLFEIQTYFLQLHDTLGTRQEAPDKDLFDAQHTQIWTDCNTALQARKTELEAKATLTDEEKAELAQLEIILPSPFEPDPDTIRAEEILATSPDSITMPEMWALLRIYGRRLGYRFD